MSQTKCPARNPNFAKKKLENGIGNSWLIRISLGDSLHCQNGWKQRMERAAFAGQWWRLFLEGERTHKMIFLSPLPVWYHRVLQSFIFSNKLLSNTTLGPLFLSKTQSLDNHNTNNVDEDVDNNVGHKKEYRRSPGGRTGNWMWSSTHPPAN